MSSERVANLLAGRKPDRLPWLPELNEGFVRRVLNRPAPAGHIGGGREDYPAMEAECAARIRADHLHRVISVRTRRRRVEVEQAGDVTIFHTPAGDLRQNQHWDADSGSIYTYEHLIKGTESFAAYRAMVQDELYEPDYEAAAAAIAASGLATIDVPATPLMHLLMWIMDVQPTLMAVMDAREHMVELMAAMHEKNKEYYRLAAAGPGQIFRPMEDTSAMLTGPAMYADHCVAHLNDYAEIVHAHGKLFVPHMCGHLGGMLDVLADVDLDGIEAITPPPLGNADLPDMRRRLGQVWLIGGVDPSMYATATPEGMTRHVRNTLDAMRGDRHFVLGHEEIPAAAKMENVAAVAALVEATAQGFYD